MSETKCIKAVELFSLVNEILEQGGSAWIIVTGMSMYPFLREMKDCVELSRTSYDNINKGDIVLTKRESGAYVLHRVLKKENRSFFIIGDAQQWIEGPVLPEHLIAVVTKIKRGSRVVDCSNLLLRFAVYIWRLLIPQRHRIIKCYSLFRLQLNKFSKKLSSKKNT